jgi:probable phosphoglycerate mutase
VPEETYPQRRFTPPPGAVEVVLVRHGASEAAVPGEPFESLEGRANPALSDIGRQQAVQVAERLRHEEISALFCTTLERTKQTAAPLAEHTRLTPTEIPELAEVSLGDWEGGELRIRAANRDPLFFEVMAAERWDAIPGAEPADDFAARVKRGLQAVLERAEPDSKVVVVAHGGVIGELCRQAADSRPFAFIHSDNCSITRLVCFPGADFVLLRSFNDTAHLDGFVAVK